MSAASCGALVEDRADGHHQRDPGGRHRQYGAVTFHVERRNSEPAIGDGDVARLQQLQVFATLPMRLSGERTRMFVGIEGIELPEQPTVRVA